MGTIYVILLEISFRMHKDVALISLANVLHRARYSNEAAIVVHAALDVSKELNVNHFTLGNIYAVSTKYVQHFLIWRDMLWKNIIYMQIDTQLWLKNDIKSDQKDYWLME